LVVRAGCLPRFLINPLRYSAGARARWAAASWLPEPQPAAAGAGVALVEEQDPGFGKCAFDRREDRNPDVASSLDGFDGKLAQHPSGQNQLCPAYF
jgi:hypothetical protein